MYRQLPLLKRSTLMFVGPALSSTIETKRRPAGLLVKNARSEAGSYARRLTSIEN